MKGEDIFLIGTKEGPCPLCGENRVLLVLRDGLVACRDCLDTMAQIMKMGLEPLRKEDLFRYLKG